MTHGLLGSVVRTAYVPYLDRAVFDFLAGLPEEMFADKTFHSETIARAHPQIETGYAKKMPAPRESHLQYARQGLPFALRASSLLLDRFATPSRLARSLLVPRYNHESSWVVFAGCVACSARPAPNAAEWIRGLIRRLEELL